MPTSRNLTQKTISTAVAKAVKGAAPAKAPAPAPVVKNLPQKAARIAAKKKPAPKPAPTRISQIVVPTGSKKQAVVNSAARLATAAMNGDPYATTATDNLLNMGAQPDAAPAVQAAAQAAEEVLRGGAEQGEDYLEDEDESFEDEEDNLGEEANEYADEFADEDEEEDDVDDDDEVGAIKGPVRRIGRILVPANFPLPPRGFALKKPDLLKRMREINKVFKVGKLK